MSETYDDEPGYDEIENGQIRIVALGADVVIELAGGVATLTMGTEQARALAAALLTASDHIDADATDLGAELLGGG